MFTHMGRKKYWMNCGKSRSRCNCKAVHTRYRHQLLVLLDEVDMPSRTQIRHMQLLKKITKWPSAAILDDRKSLSIAFLAILEQYATFNFSDFFSQNGCRRPFWMTKNHFRSHFSSFQINTQLYFYKMAAGGHFRWPKITFDHYSWWNLFTKWPPAAILDDRKSLFITFIVTSDQYTTLFVLAFFYKMATGVHFGWPKITFNRISRQFRSIRNF